MNIKSYCDYKHNKNMSNANNKKNEWCKEKSARFFSVHIRLYIEEERGRGGTHAQEVMW